MDIIFRVLRYLKKHSNLIKNAIFLALVVFCVIQSLQITNFKTSYKDELELNARLTNEINELQQQKSIYIKQLEEKNAKIQELERNKKEESQEPKTNATAGSGNNKTSSSSNSSSSISVDINVDKKYPEAQKVWNCLKSMGLNDYVCAGILGNIMAEVGGQTLDFSRWPQYSKGSHYGICQWGGSRRSRLLNNFGKSLDAQLAFLSVEIYEEIPKGSSFYNMQDEKQAALYFAKHFERCSSKSYNVRQKNATKALEYFTK
jgi:hypothetical protein